MLGKKLPIEWRQAISRGQKGRKIPQDVILKTLVTRQPQRDAYRLKVELEILEIVKKIINENRYPSDKTISEMSPYSENTIRRHRKRLIEKKLWPVPLKK